MFYTVISKSGWSGDFWKVQETFTNKDEAEAYKTKIHQRRDATSEHYNVEIKAHKKHLADLLTYGDLVRFSDGTSADVDW